MIRTPPTSDDRRARLRNMRLRVRPVLVRAALVVGLILGFMAACGGEPDKLTAKTLFPRVAAAQAKAGSSYVDMKLTAPSGQSFRSHGQMKLGKSAKDTAMAMSVNGDTGGLGTVELRLVDQTFYISLGALTQGKFVKIDLRDKSNPIAREYGDIIENLDPARQVQQYQDAVTKFDASAKPVKIDDVQTQPYTITIDPRKASAMPSMPASMELPKRITFELFIGPDDLPRRMISRAPSAAGSTRIQMDYTRWGDEVTIEAPGASRITNDSLLNHLGS